MPNPPGTFAGITYVDTSRTEAALRWARGNSRGVGAAPSSGRDDCDGRQEALETNFGIVTDLETGPNGNLFVVSLSQGAIHEIARR